MKWISRIKQIFPHRFVWARSVILLFCVFVFVFVFFIEIHITHAWNLRCLPIIQANNNCLFVCCTQYHLYHHTNWLPKKPICPSNFMLWLGQCSAASKVQRFSRDIDVFDRITSMLTRFVHYECAVYRYKFSDYQTAAHIVHASDESVKPIALICARCSCSAIMVAHLSDFLFSLV